MGAALKNRAMKVHDRVVVHDGTCAPVPTEYAACVFDPETDLTTSQGIDPTLYQPAGLHIPTDIILVQPQGDRQAGQLIPLLGLEEFYITKITAWVKLVPYFAQWFQPPNAGPGTCQDQRAIQIYDGWQVRAGMLKEAWNWDGDDWEVPTRDPLDPEEWADRKWLKRVHHQWTRTHSENTVGGCCDDSFVFGETSGVLAGGTGTISTDVMGEPYSDALDPCDGSFANGTVLDTAHSPNPVLRFSSRRRLKMSPSEGLTIHLNWSNGGETMAFAPQADVNTRAVAFSIRAHAELTIER